MKIHGFPPIARADARVLILGTMPSKTSLRAREYYAHPQNTFWKITAAILGFEATDAYRLRIAALKANRIALWDVLRSCTRESSLDSDIDLETIATNDFSRFFRKHPRIGRVCFNGGTAEKVFVKYIRPTLKPLPDVEYIRLPSTSPAHAGIPRAVKLRAWRAIREQR